MKYLKIALVVLLLTASVQASRAKSLVLIAPVSVLQRLPPPPPRPPLPFFRRHHYYRHHRRHTTFHIHLPPPPPHPPLP